MMILKYTSEKSKNIETFRVEKFPCSIGRSIQNDLVIHDDSISANHGLIDQTEKGFVIRDQGSTNGMEFQGKKYSEIDILKNLKISLGSVIIEFIVEEDIDKTRVISIPEEFYKDSISSRLKKIGFLCYCYLSNPIYESVCTNNY